MTRWRMFKGWFDELRTERRMRRHVREAAELFAALEPHWAGAMFDEPFLSRFEPQSLLRTRPSELAVAWASQFSYSDPLRRERDIARAASAAEAFLGLLRDVTAKGRPHGRSTLAASYSVRRRPRGWSSRRGART